VSEGWREVFFEKYRIAPGTGATTEVDFVSVRVSVLFGSCAVSSFPALLLLAAFSFFAAFEKWMSGSHGPNKKIRMYPPFLISPHATLDRLRVTVEER